MKSHREKNDDEISMHKIDYFFGRVPKQYKESYYHVKQKTNIGRTFAFSIYIIVMQIVLNVLNIIKPDAGDTMEDMMTYVMLSLFMIIIGISYFVLSILVKRSTIQNKYVRNALPYSLLYIYVIVQLIFLFLNLEKEQTFNSYIIAIIIISFFIITSPAESIGIIAVALVITLCMSVYTSRNRFHIALITDTWANVLIITFLCGFMSCVIHNMYINNFLASARLKESNEKLQDMASTDMLTGVFNRRGFFQYLDRNLDRKVVQKGVFAILMIDVDFFKKYNDRNGHLEGDACLLKVAQTLKQALEHVGGSICRYGGEEFLGIYNAKDMMQLQEVAETCRMAVESRRMIGKISKEQERTGPITVSIGVSYVIAGNKIKMDEMIKRADDNLYKAKSNGRNQVFM